MMFKTIYLPLQLEVILFSKNGTKPVEEIMQVILTHWLLLGINGLNRFLHGSKYYWHCV